MAQTQWIVMEAYLPPQLRAQAQMSGLGEMGSFGSWLSKNWGWVLAAGAAIAIVTIPSLREKIIYKPSTKPLYKLKGGSSIGQGDVPTEDINSAERDSNGNPIILDPGSGSSGWIYSGGRWFVSLFSGGKKTTTEVSQSSVPQDAIAQVAQFAQSQPAVMAAINANKATAGDINKTNADKPSGADFGAWFEANKNWATPVGIGAAVIATVALTFSMIRKA